MPRMHALIVSMLGLLLAAPLVAGASPADMRAIVYQDTMLRTVRPGAESTEMPLLKGEEIRISLELSSDRELFVESQAHGPGFVEREAIRWPDGSPVPASPFIEKSDSAETVTAAPRAGNRVKSSEKSAGKPARSRAGRDSRPRGIPQLLLGLISDASPEEYPTQIAKDAQLSKEEKVFALRVYYKYIQEMKGRLARDSEATDDEKAKLQEQSEKLLESLAKLEEQGERKKRGGGSGRS